MMFRWPSRRWLMLALGLIGLYFAVTIHGVQAKPAAQVVPEAIAPATFAETAQSPQSLLDEGRQQYQAGRFAEAKTAWQAATQQYQRQGDRLNQSLTLSYLSLAYQDLAEWDAAQDAIDQSLSLLKAVPNVEAVLWAQVLNVQASLLLHRGSAETALSTWQQAQHYYEQAGDREGSIGSQINQAYALQTLGYYRRARQQLEALNQVLAPLPNSTLKISALRTLGAALQTIGATQKSQAALLQGLEIARTLKAQTELYPILLRLGQLAETGRQLEAASQYFQQAEQATANPLEQLQVRLARLHLLLTAESTGPADPRAIALAVQIRQQLVALPASRASLYGAINLVGQLNQRKNTNPILPMADLTQLMEQAVQAAQRLGDVTAEAYAFYQAGQTYKRAQQWPAAQTAIANALTLARQVHADDIIVQTAWQLGQIERRNGRPQAAMTYYTEALTALKSVRGDLLAINPDIQFSFRNSIEPMYREFVDLILTDQSQPDGLTKARNLIESLQVTELDNFFREACLDKVREIDTVDPQATVIYPMILPDRIVVIVATAGQPLRSYTTPKPQAEVEKNLNDFFLTLNPIADSQLNRRLATQLYTWLIQPAEQDQALANAKTLVFVLDSRLRKIPMAALYDGEKYLIEKYAVTLSPGMQLMEGGDLSAQKIQAFVGGISESRHGFTALPEVASEVKAITKTVRAEQLLNQEFTSDAIADRVKYSQANVVHLATHGQFSSRQEDTFLLTWDGQVNIRELAELLESRQGNRQKIDLLVLSACDTAVGDDQAILGLAGLAVKSGARSTLATLWPIKDRAAAQLMDNFYQQLHGDKAIKAEALRQAQLSLLRTPEFKDPFFWSSFVLVGNWK